MRRLILHVLCALCLCSGALAQNGADAVSDDSPRAALQRFFEHIRNGQYKAAASLLDVPPGQAAEAPDLARRLKAVLDHRLWIDLDAVSGSAEGNLDDKLLPRLEDIGKIAGPTGTAEPVRLVRFTHGGRGGWRFSRATVARIDTWYEALPNRWLMERLPQPVLRVGPFGLMWWQWLALPILALLSALIGRVLSWLTRKVLARIAAHTAATWDDMLVSRSRGPLRLLWAIIAAYVMLPGLALLPPAQDLAHAVLKSGAIAALFWTVLRSIDLASDLISRSEAVQSPTARSVLPIASRFAKVAVVAMLAIAVLSNFGLPVASLLAGLGVGGVALALAAQKTVENLFGALSLGIDRPFRIGDFVKVGDVSGHVESIGLRSTRIRTLDRTLVTMPNGGLADSRVESIAARDRIRLYTVLSLEYGTTEVIMRRVLAEIEELLRSDVRVLPDSIGVNLKELAAYSLNIEVAAALMTQDWAVFLVWRQNTLLSIMGIVERAGTAFAFPTRSVHVRPSVNNGAAPSLSNGGDSAASGGDSSARTT
jgi:MscS family membrane protein